MFQKVPCFMGLFEKAAGCRGGAPLCLFLESLKILLNYCFWCSWVKRVIASCQSPMKYSLPWASPNLGSFLRLFIQSCSLDLSPSETYTQNKSSVPGSYQYILLSSWVVEPTLKRGSSCPGGFTTYRCPAWPHFTYGGIIGSKSSIEGGGSMRSPLSWNLWNLSIWRSIYCFCYWRMTSLRCIHLKGLFQKVPCFMGLFEKAAGAGVRGRSPGNTSLPGHLWILIKNYCKFNLIKDRWNILDPGANLDKSFSSGLMKYSLPQPLLMGVPISNQFFTCLAGVREIQVLWNSH